MESDLFTAIEANDLDKVKTLIENGVNLEDINEDSYTSLVYAIYKSENLEIVKLLIDSGANVNIKDDDDYILISVLRNEYFDIAKLLINGGADVNVKGSLDYTPLMCACFNENHFDVDLIKILIEKGADVNARDDEGKTALWHLWFWNSDKVSFKIIKLFIDKGLNIDDEDDEGNKFLDNFSGATEKKIQEYIKTKKRLDFLKNLTLPEEVVCFDEIGHCDILVKDFVKTTDTILIKIGENIKGYNRDDIIKYYNIKNTLYSSEKLYPGDIEKLKNQEYLFFSTVDTGNNIFILIPQTKEKFFS
jgi:hypothetical protein